MRRTVVWVTLGLSCLACSDSFGVEPSELPLVHTYPDFELPAAGVSERLDMPFSLVNETNRVLYASFSCRVVIERLEPSGWVHQWGARECLLGLERVTYLAPGEPIDQKVSPRVDSTWPTGDYRLRLESLSDRLDGDRPGDNIPLAFRLSNVFRMTRPR